MWLECTSYIAVNGLLDIFTAIYVHIMFYKTACGIKKEIKQYARNG